MYLLMKSGLEPGSWPWFMGLNFLKINYLKNQWACWWAQHRLSIGYGSGKRVAGSLPKPQSSKLFTHGFSSLSKPHLWPPYSHPIAPPFRILRVSALISELAAAAAEEKGIVFEEAVEDRLFAYSCAVAHFPTAVKEFKWRNGWFYSFSEKANAEGNRIRAHCIPHGSKN